MKTDIVEPVVFISYSHDSDDHKKWGIATCNTITIKWR